MKKCVHILTQYLWPDCAPTAIYAEQIGLCFQRNGHEVKMVSGSGSYRRGSRGRPDLSYLKLPTHTGKRGSMLSTLGEYRSVYLSFKKYVLDEVREGDVVFSTAAPPQTIHLIGAIQQKKARAIYRLEDYYPDLLRGFLNYPGFVRQILHAHWSRKLRQWDRVGRISSNLGYNGPNVLTVRNWPTLDLGQPQPFQPKTACYFGNLGYGHCLASFVTSCETLRREGYSITVVGDGPKISQLPSWIKKTPSVDEATLIEMHWQAEIHLIAADPKMTTAIFPSKYWNSRATGRRIVASGFAGAMLTELKEANALTKLPSPEAWLSLLEASAD